jgi:diaminopimelate epimerase
MADLYDARGNRYLVASPAEAESLPSSPAEAARDRRWITPTLSVVGLADHDRKLSDGLLVGPFSATPPFDVLIVNTDGTLAERSGNGLTIFAAALQDRGLAGRGEPFELRVHHTGKDAETPLSTMACLDGPGRVWLDVGRPDVGPAAVGARAEAISATELNECAASRVKALAQIDSSWSASVFVRLGNPHCVTWLAGPSELPAMTRLRGARLHEALKQIAFAPPVGGGTPCPGGVNLQWATVAGPNLIAARVFERGEGPTRSSGTSACAVATAAYHLGLVEGPVVRIRMPGGMAQVRIDVEGGRPHLHYYGVARRIAPQP